MFDGGGAFGAEVVSLAARKIRVTIDINSARFDMLIYELSRARIKGDSASYNEALRLFKEEAEADRAKEIRIKARVKQ